MLKRFFLVLFCVLAIPVMASHIVGGEFEVQHVSGNIYRVNLIIYFDKLNGSAEAKDPQAVARVFRKRDNAVMIDQLQLDLISEEDVLYTQPACSQGELKTAKLIYSTTVTLHRRAIQRSARVLHCVGTLLPQLRYNQYNQQTT